ncbi:MAG: molybdopterin-guanine dinucleotide biosynthesis protein MobB, partial [Candidatus Thermoplasmatota archaeon]|nr:molybdopterin-guanine dinucleotide biosynthesis protein MobB [Candidatus Thermoplasmatota archaeon]
MVPIISIVGKSDSGKTTLIERLVPELITRGYR